VQGKVGILGAGVGGLYTALILDSLDIKYEILEASNRTGGRLFTHKFENGNAYDYFVCRSFHAHYGMLTMLLTD
jgi:protoporphyrinogen oxidase